MAIRLSPFHNNTKNQLFRDLAVQLEHYVYFPVNSYTSDPLSENDMYELHCLRLARLQRIAFQNFKEKLTVLALSNYASVDRRAELLELLADLTDDELISLCDLLSLRTSYPEGTNIPLDRTFFLEVLVETYRRREGLVEQARKLNVYPNEVRPSAIILKVEISFRPQNPRIRAPKRLTSPSPPKIEPPVPFDSGLPPPFIPPIPL